MPAAKKRIFARNFRFFLYSAMLERKLDLIRSATFILSGLGVVNEPGIFLTKLDGTSKGGIVFSICEELAVPIQYIGTGESPDDIALFSPHDFIEGIFS